MKNETLINEAKMILKGLLAECNDGNRIMFKRMYANNNLELSTDEAVDQMDVEKIDWAISQTKKTLEKNQRNLA